MVVVAANNWDGIKLHDRHVAENLAAHGPVLYVDPPVSRLAGRRDPVQAGSRRGPRLRVVAPNLARLTPVVPAFPFRPATLGLTNLLVRRALRQAVRRLGARPAAVLNGAPLLRVLGVCGERRSVYWAQDDFVGLAAQRGQGARRMAEAEQRQGGRAGVVVAANPKVEASWRSRHPRVVLVPYGCDPGHYADVDAAPAPPDVSLPGPVAGFIGHLNFRTDPRLLEAVADRGVSVLLVGPRDRDVDLDGLLARPNVTWVGPRRFEDLPGYMRLIDVGLVPYGHGPFNEGSFPLKTLEYLAAGRPVVSTDLPATRWLATPLTSIADDPAGFAAAVAALAAAPRTPEAMDERRAFARRHSWQRRAELLAHVLLDPPGRPAGPAEERAAGRFPPT